MIRAVNAGIDLAEPGDLADTLGYRSPRVWDARTQRRDQAIEQGAAPEVAPAHATAG